jgi:hypothetical protein
MKLIDEQMEALCKPLPDWAVKDHPTKKGMSAIHPMAIIDRLNEVFGVTGWSFTTEYLSCNPAKQKKRDGTERDVFIATVKGRLEIEDCVIEQYGGNTNDDAGDTLKGSATDALTKIASYLGIGASIYKGQGNGEDKDYKDNGEVF